MRSAPRILRKSFLAADVGITGANFLIAETGSSIIVTNEGNGDLTQSLPRAHIVLASLEKVVPTLEDASTILRLLARSATGQEFSAYTTISTGPRRAADIDGPGEYHVVLLDNGRSALLGSEFEDMLRCIRCAACLNHCPVYAAIGGHSYGWVYPGPMGAVLTPSLLGVDLEPLRFDEEHGIFVAGPSETSGKGAGLPVGSWLRLVPGYAPATVNMYDNYYVVADDVVVRRQLLLLRVEAPEGDLLRIRVRRVERDHLFVHVANHVGRMRRVTDHLVPHLILRHGRTHADHVPATGVAGRPRIGTPPAGNKHVGVQREIVRALRAGTDGAEIDPHRHIPGFQRGRIELKLFQHDLLFRDHAPTFCILHINLTDKLPS